MPAKHWHTPPACPMLGFSNRRPFRRHSANEYTSAPNLHTFHLRQVWPHRVAKTVHLLCVGGRFGRPVLRACQSLCWPCRLRVALTAWYANVANNNLRNVAVCDAPSRDVLFAIKTAIDLPGSTSSKRPTVMRSGTHRTSCSSRCPQKLHRPMRHHRARVAKNHVKRHLVRRFLWLRSLAQLESCESLRHRLAHPPWRDRPPRNAHELEVGVSCNARARRLSVCHCL